MLYRIGRNRWDVQMDGELRKRRRETWVIKQQPSCKHGKQKARVYREKSKKQSDITETTRKRNKRTERKRGNRRDWNTEITKIKKRHKKRRIKDNKTKMAWQKEPETPTGKEKRVWKINREKMDTNRQRGNDKRLTRTEKLGTIDF